MSDLEIKVKQDSLVRRIKKEGLLRIIHDLSKTNFSAKDIADLNDAHIFDGSVPNVEFITSLLPEPKVKPSYESMMMVN